MKKITPTDVPEDLIEQLADRLQVDGVMAVDMLTYSANVVADAVIDFDAERYFDRTRLDIGLGYFDHYAPRNLPPRRCRSANNRKKTKCDNLDPSLRDVNVDSTSITAAPH